MLKASTALEWPRFLSLARDLARTAPGRAAIDALAAPEAWAPDVESANLRQAETHEATDLLLKEDLWLALDGLGDPGATLENLARGAVLEIAELAALRGWARAAEAWRMAEVDAPGLFRAALAALPELRAPLRDLERVLTPDGELSENASPRLAQLHSEIRGLKREIAAVLDHLMKTFAQKGVLQENFTDVRDGRYVLPVKIASQNEIDGIIYEASASRQTVFVEPREVAQLNNRLRQRQNDLIQEVFAVLLAVSKAIGPFADGLAAAAEVLAHWDAVQARARLGLHYGGRPIEVTEARRFVMPGTAHPLLYWSLPRERIIRNEVDFGAPARSLLLTGPNTGGKTVLLKTLGLAGFCARTGFPFPGLESAQVPFFDAFFADLGDSQSIEEHLSSFSGHVARFKEILAEVTPRSLVLIDELNSATDPEEGAALGRAFLETVMEREALIVTTTHDPNLKAAAISDPRVLSASMQFDEAARTPSYRIALGVPGRSRALETAERLGMPGAVVALARTYLTREHNVLEKTLAKLEEDARVTRAAREESERLRDEAAALRREWLERTQAAVTEMLDRARLRLRKVVETAQEEVRAALVQMESAKSRKDLEQIRAGVQARLAASGGELESALETESPEIAAALARARAEAQAAREAELEAQALRPGDPVRVPKWKSVGKILELRGTQAKVALGAIQMTMPLDELEALPTAEVEAARRKARKGSSNAGTASFTPDSQVDLRGMRFEEGMSELTRYLDQAYRSGNLAQVTVVHGLGTGALREGARKLLAKLPYVKAFRDGGAGQGGSGATLVEFEDR